MAEKEVKFNSKLYICNILRMFSLFGLLKISGATRQMHQNELVYEFDVTSSVPRFNWHEETVVRHDELHRRYKRELRPDSKCKLQSDEMQRNLNGTTFHQTHTFASTTAMAVAWVGEDEGSLIIVLSETLLGTTKQTHVLRSNDYGVTYSNLTQDVGLVPNTFVIKKHSGLQRHSSDSTKVYLIGEGSYMYTSRDGGLSFVKIDLSFSVSGDLVFSDYNTDYLIALDNDKKMYVSKDNGESWREVKFTDKKIAVQDVVWGVKPDESEDEGLNQDTADTIYFTYYTTSPYGSFLDQTAQVSSLAKSTDGGDTYTDILEKVVSFERKGKFLSAVSQKQHNSDSTNLMISTDGGNEFSEIKLPFVEEDKRISVLDIEDNRVFIHVHDKKDTGKGTLYTSDSGGLRYSRSLRRHFFPLYAEVHDFYEVKSMRGVYITSQLNEDDSIHTMISYNRGADWQNITRPKGVTCKDESKGCYLQLHGLYSVQRGVNTDKPLSKKTAVGLILAHGQVAHALQKTDPDVFVSRDGGYSWDLTLKGPHHIQIGDHGGLLVAVSKLVPNPQIIKFSFDEGRCWHEYKFADESFRLTGLLVGPSGKSSVVMLFGYLYNSKQWHFTVIDFQKVTSKKCEDNDYEPWKAHAALRADEGPEVRGCVLGLKETFMRLKKNSWCYNGYNYVIKTTAEECTCTKIDYECDYGYVRKGVSHDCVKDDTVLEEDVNKCLLDYSERNMSLGKIPGDKCIGGFQPPSLADIRKKCNEQVPNVERTTETTKTTQANTTEDETQEIVKHQLKKGSFSSLTVSIPVAVVTILIVTFLLGLFLARKYAFQRGGSYDKIKVWSTEVQNM